MAERLTFQELLREAKKLKFAELRADEEKGLEFVARLPQLSQVSAVLEKFFGPALKPTGQIPSKEVEELTAAYGGIWDNQTLYYRNDNGRPYFAMFRPWGDKTSVTVKIFEESS